MNHGGNEPRGNLSAAAGWCKSDLFKCMVCMHRWTVPSGWMSKNVRVESTVCEHDRQTSSSAHQAKKFHKKVNFFMFRKDVSTEMGEPRDITMYGDGM